MSGAILPLRPTCLHSMNGDIFTFYLQLCYSIVLLLIVYLYLCQHGVPRALGIRMRHSSKLADRPGIKHIRLNVLSKAVTQASAVTDFYNLQLIYHRFK